MLRLTRAQSRLIDARAESDLGISVATLMDRAAAAVARHARELLARAGTTEVVILAGSGNNGGDGLTAAVLLAAAGIPTRILLAATTDRLSPLARHHHAAALAAGIPVIPATPAALLNLRDAILVDALFGVGLASPPRPAEAALIQAALAAGTPTLAVDLPSGLDADLGLPLGPTIRAAATLTFVAEKQAFANPLSRPYTGSITVDTLGLPMEWVLAITTATA